MNKTKLAEFIGIMLGDGNINTKNNNYRIVITGHSEEDYDYLIKYVKPLIKDLFKLKANLWRHKNKNAIAIATYSKELTNELISYGLSAGPKTMEIPNIVKNNKVYTAKFIRGLADTDFSITFMKKTHSYPVITANFSKEKFTKEIKEMLTKFNIKANIYKTSRNINNKVYILYQIDIYGKYNLDKWLKNIGFSNPKHLTKIAIWKKLGYYTPHTPYKERLTLLKQKAL